MVRPPFRSDRPAAARGDQLPPLGGRSLAEARSDTLFRARMMLAGVRQRTLGIKAAQLAALIAAAVNRGRH